MIGRKNICLIKQVQAVLIIQKNTLMLSKKNIKAGIINFLFINAFLLLLSNNLFGDTLLKSESTAELSVLDKVSSKNTNIKIQIGEEFFFQNLNIKVLKCYN